KWSIFTAEESRGMKRFQFLAFAQVEALADINKRWHGRITRPERSRDHRTDMRRGHRLRWRITCVPLVLVTRVQNETQVAGGIRADQRRAVHHPRNLFQSLRE